MTYAAFSASTSIFPTVCAALAGFLAVCIATAANCAAPLSTAQERALNKAESFKECDACPEMVVVPAGAFTMGSPSKEEGHNPNEEPQRRVTISRRFAVGRFAVTFDEWDACRMDGGCNGHDPFDAGWGRGRRPVINVSFGDANAYVAWLSRKTGRTYRLLREVEREFVTRAGTQTPFWWGSSISTSQANYNGTYTYGKGARGEYRRETVPVDTFAPNPWGLYQVHGNVSEWMEDCWNDSYRTAATNGSTAPRGDCGFRVIRGGNWGNVPSFLRSAARFLSYAHNRYSEVGFRVARALTP